MTQMELPAVIIEELRRISKREGQLVEEILIEVATRDLNPKDRGERYIRVARELLKRAKEELVRGDLRQASEKIWGAVALATKAHAYAKEGRRLASHGEIREYKDKIAERLGGWVIVAFQQASDMHTNFYEGWATRRDVEKAFEAAEKFVEAVSNDIGIRTE